MLHRKRPRFKRKPFQIPDEKRPPPLKLSGVSLGPRSWSALRRLSARQDQPKQGMTALTALMNDPYEWLTFNLTAWKDDRQA